MESILNGIMRSSRKTFRLVRPILPTTYYIIGRRFISTVCPKAVGKLDLKPSCTMYCWLRCFSNVPSSTSLKTDEDSLGTKVVKLLGWMGGFYSRKATLTRSAKTLYECCADGLAYDEFYKAAGMPDTFQSWFLVNQLHVWMCLVRLKPEGKDGRYMYRRMVQIFWEDVEERMKVMGMIENLKKSNNVFPEHFIAWYCQSSLFYFHSNQFTDLEKIYCPRGISFVYWTHNGHRLRHRHIKVVDGSVRKNSLKELMQEFYGLILAYDEGLLSHDRVLAASLWRNMFHDKKNTDASNLALFVDYVRRQILHIENIDSEKLLTTGYIEWLPFQESL